MNILSQALTRSLRTISSYEGFAREYDTLVNAVPTPNEETALRRFGDIVGPDGHVLEVGSGPGRDADFLESMRISVRRTDATEAFLLLQAERGKRGELLNLLTDELGGPYDGVLAMCVLIHIDRGCIDLVLGKIASALRPGGAFLVSMRKGDGETVGDYHTVYWQRDAFVACLGRSGLVIRWENATIDTDGDHWLTFLAVRAR